MFAMNFKKAQGIRPESPPTFYFKNPLSYCNVIAKVILVQNRVNFGAIYPDLLKFLFHHETRLFYKKSRGQGS